MILELLKHRDFIRIMMALERKTLRFTEIQKTLDLNPTEVNRALIFLRKGLWIIPKTVPTEKGPVRVEYGLGKRGAAFLESFESFRTQAGRRAAALGKA
ncbi:MAG: hypothetical protein ACHQ49_11300 [Elusimicrobiota bacterium]